MNTDEYEKIEINVPDNCPKCRNGAFYRMSDKGPWRCYFCDSPPIVRQMQENQRNEK